MADAAIFGVDEARDRARSRRTRTVRPRTENIHRISRRRLALLTVEAPPLEGTEFVERPHTRGDCPDAPRPCPFVGCRHNLYLEVSPTNGSLKLRFPDLEPGDMPADRSCVLDIADRGGASLQEAADCLNTVRERIRQIQQSAFSKVAREVPELRALLHVEPDYPPPAGLEVPDQGDEEIPMATTETKKKPEARRLELDLPCTLTPDELIAKGELVAKLHDEAAKLRIKKKQASDEIGGEIKGREGSIGALVRQIRTRSETRPVECAEELDFKDGIARTRRLDTKAIVATRPLTMVERQPGLFEAIPGGKVDEDATTKKKGRKTKAAKAPEDAAAPAEVSA